MINCLRNTEVHFCFLFADQQHVEAQGEIPGQLYFQRVPVRLQNGQVLNSPSRKYFIILEDNRLQMLQVPLTHVRHQSLIKNWVVFVEHLFGLQQNPFTSELNRGVPDDVFVQR